MTTTRPEYATPSPDEPVAISRIAELNVRLYMLAQSDPRRFAEAERAVAEIEWRAPDLERRADSALEAALARLEVSADALRTAMAADGTVVAVVCQRDVVRFVSGAGCRSLRHPPSRYTHQHLGMLALHMCSPAFEGAIVGARRQHQKAHDVYDDQWVHTAVACPTLTLVVSARR